MSARIGNITFDCDDALVLGTIWSRVLGLPLDEGANSEYCSIGRSDADRSRPAWFFEKVPELKTSKNRTYLDLIDYDTGAVPRLVPRGARATPNALPVEVRSIYLNRIVPARVQPASQ